MKNVLETPEIASHTHSHTAYAGGVSGHAYTQKINRAVNSFENRTPFDTKELNIKLKKEIQMTKKRMVQIFIADPDPKMPLDDSLIYEGKAFLTDSDDEELFFDIPIKELLIKHNVKREKIIERKATDVSFVQYLEPIRIRELKMTVVNLAEF